MYFILYDQAVVVQFMYIFRPEKADYKCYNAAKMARATSIGPAFFALLTICSQFMCLFEFDSSNCN